MFELKILRAGICFHSLRSELLLLLLKKLKILMKENNSSTKTLFQNRQKASAKNKPHVWLLNAVQLLSYVARALNFEVFLLSSYSHISGNFIWSFDKDILTNHEETFLFHRVKSRAEQRKTIVKLYIKICPR